MLCVTLVMINPWRSYYSMNDKAAFEIALGFVMGGWVVAVYKYKNK